MYDAAPELYNELLGTYFDEYEDFSDEKRSNVDPKYDPPNGTLEVYDYGEWYKENLSEEEKLDNLQPREVDEEEVKQERGIKILTPDKLLTRLLVLLAQIKAGNNSYKLKNEIKQIVYLLYQHN